MHYLDPFFQSWMETEDFHAGFSVRIVCRFELDLSDAQFLEELSNGADEIAECQISIGYDTFYLVKFGQMGCVECLIAEYTIDAEIFGRHEASFLIG